MYLSHDWEKQLMALALPAAHSRIRHSSDVSVPDGLAHEWEICREVTRRHSRSFFIASGLLPPEKRRAVRALYAFCRITDNLVDELSGDAQVALADWHGMILDPSRHGQHPVASAWAAVRRSHAIPRLYVEQLLDGVRRDLRQTRYDTFEDLVTYAYGVASTVGLMSMHIVGFAGPGAIPYAIKLGVALQLTNILRDVGEDWQRGRVYLPQAELTAAGLSEANLAAGQVTERWRNFMRFQIARARHLYCEAWPGIRRLHPDGRLAIAAAARFYLAILDDIEAADYDVFSRRAHIGGFKKLSLLLPLWVETRRMAA